jgi:hypothetical protein
MTEKQLTDFLYWAKSKGAQYDNVKMKEFGVLGLGGELLNDLKADDSILSISLDIMINSRVVLKHEFGRKLQKIYEESKELKKNIRQVQQDETNGSIVNNADNFGFPMVALYLFLVHERRNKDSFWKLYFPVLPKEYNTPLYFSKEDEEKLRGSNLYTSTKGIKQRMASLHSALFPLLTKIDPTLECTYDELKWAYSTIWSRAFPIKYDEDVVPSLLPVISILNHEYGAKMTYFTDPKENRFHLKTQVPLKRGGQVFNNYGGKSNESFLYSYGFVVDNNSEDALYVQIGHREDDENLSRAKKKCLEENGLKMGFYIRKDGFPEDFPKSMRICVMNQEEFYFQSTNEFEMLKILKKLFLEKIGKFSTSIQEDMIELKRTRDYRTHCILTYLIGQKEILKSSLERIGRMERDLCNRNVFPILLSEGSFQTEKYFKSDFVQWTKEDPMKMVTRAPIKAGKVFYSTTIITPKEAMSSEIGKYLTFDEETNMLIYILFLRYNTKSKWTPFFVNLPIEFTTPIYMKDHSILTGTPAYEEMMNVIDHLQDIVMEVKPTLSKTDLHSYINLNNLRWALTVYDLFSFEGNIIPNPVVIPYNEGRYVVPTIVDDQYQLASHFDLVENEIISSIYPARGLSNHDLLVRHGFVIPHNANDSIPIMLDPEALSMDIVRIHIIQKIGIGFEHHIKWNVFPKKLVDFFMIHLMTDEEFNVFKVEKRVPDRIENQDDIALCIEEILGEVLNSMAPLPTKGNLTGVEKVCAQYLAEMRTIVQDNIDRIRK